MRIGGHSGENESLIDRTGSRGGECENFKMLSIFAWVTLTEMTDICKKQGREW